MLNDFEPKKIKEAKNILATRLNIANREREADMEKYKKSIFELLVEFKDKMLGKMSLKE
jgi:hypothetical protein